MKFVTTIFIILLVVFMTAHSAPKADEPTPLLLAHFMPWAVAPPISSSWGYHWTMNHYNPDNMDANGKRDIASHYYPLTGPYDSLDPDIMEYQVLLMKLSGVDGIIVDWYGSTNLWDYPGINDRTNAMFDYIEKARLQFSIMYEDQTIRNLINQSVIQDDEAVEQGKKDMQYLEDTWFTKEAYLKFDNKPVVYNFGPQFFKKSSEWHEMFSGLSTPPLFFTEDNRLAPAAVGAFPWPPMWKTTPNGTLTQSLLTQYLNEFSSKSKNWTYRTSSAFPAFHDIYKEAGVSDGYGFLDPHNGSTFQNTLEHALTDNPHVIQLVTWNDYGEGTIIEPTEEFGYLYLEILQAVKRASIDPTFQPLSRHLRMPLQIFKARKDNPNDVDMNLTLDNVFELFIDMKLDEAETLLKTITRVEQPHENYQPDNFMLEKNYPNPFNPQTTIRYYVPSSTHVNISIYNSAGQLIEKLVDGSKNSGRHHVTWNATDTSSGIYFYRLETNNIQLTKKCLLVR